MLYYFLFIFLTMLLLASSLAILLAPDSWCAGPCSSSSAVTYREASVKASMMAVGLPFWKAPKGYWPSNSGAQ